MFLVQLMWKLNLGWLKYHIPIYWSLHPKLFNLAVGHCWYIILFWTASRLLQKVQYPKIKQNLQSFRYDFRHHRDDITVIVLWSNYKRWWILFECSYRTQSLHGLMKMKKLDGEPPWTLNSQISWWDLHKALYLFWTNLVALSFMQMPHPSPPFLWVRMPFVHRFPSLSTFLELSPKERVIWREFLF